MTEQELHQARREKWRLEGHPVRTLEEARAFIHDVGFCLMFPLARQEQRVLAPSFIGAYAGSDEKLPTWQQAFADPRAAEATELMVRLLREKSAFEGKAFGETSFLVAAQVFPYFYGLIGDRNPRQLAKGGARSEYSPLARDVFEAIRTHGALSKPRLREILGGEPSAAALERALNELWSKLRITRVDYSPQEGAAWDALYRWAPERVRAGINMAVPKALSALVSQYLHAVVAAEQSEVEEFFSHLVPRSRVREAIHALLAARVLAFATVGSKTMLTMPRPKEQAPRKIV
jgi:23S rRNA pseudouridine2605 synthase